MTAATIRALIFDVDGTIADTERAHLAAFNHAFAEEGLNWRWDEAQYTQLLEISGGKERILHYWRTTRGEMVDVSGTAVSETVQRLHDLKTAAYEAMVNSGVVHLRPGVLDLIEEARTRGLGLAIATTTSPVNIAALLRKAIGPHWWLDFSVIADASSAPVKKPDPQVYRQVLQAMKLCGRHPGRIEPVPQGLSAPLHPPDGIRLNPWRRVDRDELPGEPPRERAWLRAGAPGGQWPLDPLQHARLRQRQAGTRALLSPANRPANPTWPCPCT